MAVLQLPHSSLLWLVRYRLSIATNTLRQAHVGDARGFRAQNVHVRRQNRGVRGRVPLAQHIIEVKLVKLHAFNEIAVRFWFKRRHVRVDELAVRVEVLRRYTGNQLLC